MRKASTRLPEQGTQTPSPAPDLIPAEPKNQPRTHIAIGPANGGTSHPPFEHRERWGSLGRGGKGGPAPHEILRQLHNQNRAGIL